MDIADYISDETPTARERGHIGVAAIRQFWGLMYKRG